MYACRLYHEGEPTVVRVDGVFPFDRNYYPLYGSVEQYIWFAVLVKAIAKLKGSYLAFASMDCLELYILLTGRSLSNLTPLLQEAAYPVQVLSAVLAHTSPSDLPLVCHNGRWFKL
jgi:hypothetical protein